MEKLILNENNVQLQTEAKDWEEAVRIGAEMLVSQGCAEQSYVEGIISAIKELGPYIIVADGLAMPHTRPGMRGHRHRLQPDHLKRTCLL